MGIGKILGRILALAAFSALFATSVAAQVTSRFVVPGGAATSTKAVPGSNLRDGRARRRARHADDRGVIPAHPDALRQRRPVGCSRSPRAISPRRSTTTRRPARRTPRSWRCRARCSIPINDDNLGRNTVGLVGAPTGTNLFVEKITFSVDPATPLGTYTIKPTAGGGSAVTDTASQRLRHVD